MGDIAALIAPRPLLIESGLHDPLNGKSGIKNVEMQIKIARTGYTLNKSETLLEHFIFEGGHLWYESAHPFFLKHISPQ